MEREQPEEPTSESNHEDHMTLHQYLLSKGKPIIHHCSPSEVLRRSKRNRQCPEISEINKVIGDRHKRSRDFLKLMQRSHVTQGFWLVSPCLSRLKELTGYQLLCLTLYIQVQGLPVDFCRKHMPKHDKLVILEDENGKEYEARFLAAKVGLSGGWKPFSIAQKLVEGDVVVYHLVGDCRFKVYIVRATSLGEVDGALGLLNLENHPSGRHSGGGGEGTKGTDMKGDGAIILNDAEGSGKSISFVNFQSFNIIANNLILDSELPKYVRLKYYDLCCAQKSYLHVGLLKSISCALASGIISETVKIADAIKSCKILTPQEDFALWDKTLEGFELLGMEVGFLRARLNKLVKLAMRSRKIQESKRYKQARIEHYFVTEEVETLEKKLKEKHQVTSAGFPCCCEKVQSSHR
nr:B3 domain-containing protein Os01g0234100-like isoform X2 [Coffea arabica]